jgi:hypothetical protein
MRADLKRAIRQSYERASRCESRSRTEADPYVKQELLSSAQRWLRVAHQLEFAAACSIPIRNATTESERGYRKAKRLREWLPRL